MIHSSKEITTIQGHALDVIQEYLAITYSIMETDPEMYVAVSALLSEDAMKLFSKLDTDKASIFIKHGQQFIDENKKAGIWK